MPRGRSAWVTISYDFHQFPSKQRNILTRDIKGEMEVDKVNTVTLHTGFVARIRIKKGDQKRKSCSEMFIGCDFQPFSPIWIPSLKLTARTWKRMLGIPRLAYFQWAMLLSGHVIFSNWIIKYSPQFGCYAYVGLECLQNNSDLSRHFHPSLRNKCKDTSTL